MFERELFGIKRVFRHGISVLPASRRPRHPPFSSPFRFLRPSGERGKVLETEKRATVLRDTSVRERREHGSGQSEAFRINFEDNLDSSFSKFLKTAKRGRQAAPPSAWKDGEVGWRWEDGVAPRRLECDINPSVTPPHFPLSPLPPSAQLRSSTVDNRERYALFGESLLSASFIRAQHGLAIQPAIPRHLYHSYFIFTND